MLSLTFIAIRMPAAKSREISQLNIITRSEIFALRTILGTLAPLAHQSGASVLAAPVCKSL
jgi:hypothetical protein